MARRWTKEEKDFVEEKWGLWSVSRIAKTIDRTDYAVIRYAEKNKLGSMYKGMYLTTEQVGEMFNVDSTTVNRYWIKKYGLKSVRMALKERKFWRIKLDDLLFWCEKNQDKWKATHLEEYALGEEPKWLQLKRIKDKDIAVAKRGTFWSMKEIDILKKRIEEGKTSREIAEELKRSKASVDRQRMRIKNNEFL